MPLMSYILYNATINYEWMDLMWHIIWMNEWMNDLMCQIIWMNGWYIWHITMVAMCGWEIQNLNYNWKLLETMSTCIVESSLTSQLQPHTSSMDGWRDCPYVTLSFTLSFLCALIWFFFPFYSLFCFIKCFSLSPTCV